MTAEVEPRNALKLTAKLHPMVKEYINEKTHLTELVSALGSPLNVLFPEQVGENVRSFESVISKLKLRGRIFFAHKCNRSHSLVRQLVKAGTGIDVSSKAELQHALGAGFAASRIQATGPKNPEFLTLCLLHGVVISVDSLQEIDEVLRLRKRLGVIDATKLLLRVSGFKNSQSQFSSKASRFGITTDHIEQAFEKFQKSDALRLLGLAFHLDTVSIPEKAMAIETCLELFDEAFELGLEPSVLNIGGGYKVNYLEHAEEWNAYTTAIREAVLGSRESLTWHGNSFGLTPDKGTLKGSFNVYSYYDSLTGASFLDELLSNELEGEYTAKASTLIRENGIELWIEPGRSMLDQCGITVATVNSTKTSSNGDTLVGLNMKRQDICFLDQEMFVDPVVIYQNGADEKDQDPSVPVYFAGNLCLESDLVTRRLTWLPRLPQPGDLVVFANTAGYFMDFSASESIMQPVARKVAVYKKADRFNWSMDCQYNPWFGEECEE